MIFKGFERPTDNYSKLPHSFIDLLPTIETMAEMKVVLYLLRHTWGFSEFGKPKKLTTDEFANGRKKRDQSRMDAGTGLSENSVRAGLDKAIEHGFITVEIDESDKARIEKWYCLNMEVDSEIESRPAKIAPLGAEIEERSEKETIERKEHKPDMLDMLLEQEQKSQPIRNACLDFENALLGSTVSQWPWDSNSKWQKFAKWVAAQDPAQFIQYSEWRKGDGKFHAMSNNKIRQDPQMFMDTGWPTFLAHVSMYNKNEQPEPKQFPKMVNGRLV